MNIKKILLIVVPICILAISAFLFLNKKEPEDIVFEKTVDISKEYMALRYRTDEVLANAESYTDYETWNEEVSNIVEDWKKLEEDSIELEELAIEMSEEKETSLIPKVAAYDKQEISNVFDKAPAGKKIATLAQYLGVDAKRAYAILVQDQNQVTADAWNKAGDTFQKLETSAVVIKDGCKVAGFVGGVILTGGTAGIATAGTLTQAAVVVTGVDLALEVTEDGAQIALGDKNKVSSFVKDVRTVTEPIANIMTITNIPSNLGNAFGKFDSVMVGLEQFREAAQEGKVIGVDLTNFEYNKPFQRIRQADYPRAVTVAQMEMTEVEDWLKSLNKKYEPMTEEEVKEFLKISPVKESKEIEQKEEGEQSVEKDNLMQMSEFNQLSEDEQFNSMKKIKEIFGEPDFSTTNDAGRIVFVYLDRIQDGLRSGARFTFYTLDEYKSYAESMYGWDEDDQEIWDSSEGGLTATIEVKNNEYFETLYGL
jgi:hypothetical protein